MTLILNGQELATLDEYGKKLYYSKRWDEFLLDYQFCSEEFYCNTCFRENKLVKGKYRYDSLVQCETHAVIAEELLSKLKSAIYSSGNVTVYKDLGLG